RVRIRPANRDRTSRRNARLDETGGTLVESFDWRDFDGPGDWHFAAAAHFADLDDSKRRSARPAAHRRGHDYAAENSANDRLPAGRRDTCDFVSDRGRDAADAAGSGAPRYRTQSYSRGL